MNRLGFHLSFSGCAWSLTYYCGMIEALRHCRHLETLRNIKFSGASAGSITAATGAVVAGLDQDFPFWDHVTALGNTVRKRQFGALFYMEEFLQKVLPELLPPEAPEVCSHRAYISVTSLLNGRMKGTVVEEYSDMEDLCAAITASCHIPLYSSTSNLTIPFRGAPSMDGGKARSVMLLPIALTNVAVAAVLSSFARVHHSLPAHP